MWTVASPVTYGLSREYGHCLPMLLMDLVVNVDSGFPFYPLTEWGV